MYGNSSVNLDGIRRLYDEDPAAPALLDHFAGRERNLRVTPVDRLLVNVQREGSEVSRGDLIRVLKKLQELGCGTFVPGRRGHKSRFEWDASLVSVGQVAAGEAEEFEDAPDYLEEKDSSESQMLEHRFWLRHDLSVIVELPEDLSGSEAVRLSHHIAAIPFAGVEG